MKADTQRIKQNLKLCEFTKIFTQELGWDNSREASTIIRYQNQDYQFTTLAQKKKFKIYLHTFAGHIPGVQVLKQLDLLLNDHAAAHLTIFVDAQRENQAWLWVKRVEEGKKGRFVPRLHRYNKNQNGESLVQKIDKLFISLDEEEHITLTSVLDRVMQGFDVEKVTKRFFEGFKSEHDNFLKNIENIPNDEEHLDDRKWYASIMLNRLMFVYFLQKKKVLDNRSAVKFEGDEDYLENRLIQVREECGKDNFYAFYRYFLRSLFHDGLNRPESEHTPELQKLIGNVPHINGGLFDVHALERIYPDIRIKDEVFERLFEFFRAFHWHLDDRPMRDDSEINPDVLGYIFEKYINQKQMGAYYTKEDITEYISKSTIIPFIFEKVAQSYPDDFMPDGPIWSLLKNTPDAYIYDEMAHGSLEPLPPEIEAGISDIAQRTLWNQAADEQWALPTETWREVVERRRRYREVHAKMTSGEISTINDLVTYNLNITQFAENVIAGCKKPGLLNAFYKTIEQVSVLDPTCGSGAFLFAALNILKPLYQACIERMRFLVKEQTSLPASRRKECDHIAGFQDVIMRIDQHANQEYFILKSIIISNIYGVDIMEEAIEICKLRLFLKLVAQVERPKALKPLPDIDFNVLPGNTLVGFTSLNEIRRVVTTKLLNVGDTEKTLQLIERDVQQIERDEYNFRRAQTDDNLKIDPAAKEQLRKKLEELRDKLDPYLATEYGIYASKDSDKDSYAKAYAQWHKTHKPFHWWSEFYKIMQNGGFDVIIGNPPYVERSEFKKSGYLPKGLITEKCSDVYAMFLERSTSLIKSKGISGFIIPISFVCADDFAPLQELLLKRTCIKWAAHFANRPSQLFVGAQKRLTIFIMSFEEKDQSVLFTSKYKRWLKEERNSLLSTIEYTNQDHLPAVFKHSLAKIGSELERSLVKKAFVADKRLGTSTLKNSSYKMYYVRTPGYFCQFLKFPPMTTKLSTQEIKPRGELYCDTFKTENDLYLFLAVVNSNLFYWYFTVYSDCRHMNRRDVLNFPFDLSKLNDEACKTLILLSNKLQEDYIKNKSIINKSGLQIETFSAEKSKPIIDEIDRVLAQHYGFTPEELDFIINYDIKYRMGRDNGEESEE